MFKKIFVIANITAGYYTAYRKLRHVKNSLRAVGIEPIMKLTRYRYHAKELAQEAIKNSVDLIISIGGDGTINEILNGIMECRTESNALPALGIISMGTGADLCRTLNIPFDYKKAIEIIKKGKTILMDIGLVRLRYQNHQWQRYFMNVFDIGLGGNVVRIANHIPKSFGGFLTFLISSLVGLLVSKPLDLEIYADNRLITQGSISIIGATNGKYFGGGMKIAPMASINDGYLEVLYVKNTNIFKFIYKVLLPVYEARHLLYKNLFHFPTKNLKILSKGIFLADIDGEEEKAEEVEVSIIPGAIKIIVP